MQSGVQLYLNIEEDVAVNPKLMRVDVLVLAAKINALEHVLFGHTMKHKTAMQYRKSFLHHLEQTVEAMEADLSQRLGKNIGLGFPDES